MAIANPLTSPKSRITLANDLGSGTSHINRIIVTTIDVDPSTLLLSKDVGPASPLYSRWNQISNWAKSSGIGVNAYIYRASDMASFSERLMLVLEFGNQLDLVNYKLCFRNT